MNAAEYVGVTVRPLTGVELDFRLFRQLLRIVDLDSEITELALELRRP
jgi:hypothetical protein